MVKTVENAIGKMDLLTIWKLFLLKKLGLSLIKSEFKDLESRAIFQKRETTDETIILLRCDNTI